jgi:hypothetical protein
VQFAVLAQQVLIAQAPHIQVPDPHRVNASRPL